MHHDLYIRFHYPQKKKKLKKNLFFNEVSQSHKTMLQFTINKWLFFLLLC